MVMQSGEQQILVKILDVKAPCEKIFVRLTRSGKKYHRTIHCSRKKINTAFNFHSCLEPEVMGLVLTKIIGDITFSYEFCSQEGQNIKKAKQRGSKSSQKNTEKKKQKKTRQV